MFRRWQSGGLVVVLLLSVLVAAGCGRKKADEKLAEAMMERTLHAATGEKADVDLKGEDVTIETGQGRVEITKTSEWPPDMISDVPRFAYGAVERVSKGQSEGMKSITVYLRDVEDGAFEKYHADIKAAGWESQAMTQGDSGGLISAQKGSLALQFVYGKGDRTAVVVASMMPE